MSNELQLPTPQETSLIFQDRYPVLQQTKKQHTILQNLSDIHQNPPLWPIIPIRVEIIATSAEAEIKRLTLG
ncbi:hypothetical protein L873DRAFT_1812749, partial [Choiromyces venosus 120613-1]